MCRRLPRSSRTDTPFPCTALFRAPADASPSHPRLRLARPGRYRLSAASSPILWARRAASTRWSTSRCRSPTGRACRVAIARAFLKDAPVLILDEATSHLDAVNEQALRRALDHLQAERTTVVIAHRLSTIRDATVIVVLDRKSTRLNSSQ